MSEGETGSRTAIHQIVENYINVPVGEKNKYVTKLLRANTDWISIARIVEEYEVKDTSENDVIRAILESKKNSVSPGKFVKIYFDSVEYEHYPYEVLAPSSVGVTIPYLEIYRTDELNYKEYESPFLSENISGSVDNDENECGSGSSASSDEDKSNLTSAIKDIVKKHIEVTKGKEDQYVGRLVGAKTAWTNIAKITNGHRIKGDLTQKQVIQKILDEKRKYDKKKKSSTKKNKSGNKQKYSSKNKNQKLSDELKEVVKSYFKPDANHTTLVNRFMSSKLEKSMIKGYALTSKKWLKNSDEKSVKSLVDKIYNIKEKYK